MRLMTSLEYRGSLLMRAALIVRYFSALVSFREPVKYILSNNIFINNVSLTVYFERTHLKLFNGNELN